GLGPALFANDTRLLDADLVLLDHRDTLALNHRHALGRLVRDLRHHRVGDHLRRADRHRLADDFLPHRADLGRHLFDTCLLDHVAGRHRHALLDYRLHHPGCRAWDLLDDGFGHAAADGVRHHLDLLFAHHSGRLARNHTAADAAFDECLTGAVFTGADHRSGGHARTGAGVAEATLGDS